MRHGKEIQALALAALLLLLGGCAFSSPEELYAVPRASEDYQNLQEQIDQVRGAGAEYAGPLQGTNTQPVQLMDLDGDGIQEAVAFFRTTAADGSPPLKIYIYRQTGQGDYALWNIIQGDGTAINSISYEDLDGYTDAQGRTDKEMVVSWRLSDKVYQLMAYSVRSPEAERLMNPISYTDYALWDMDKDNQREIVVLNLNTVDGIGQADYYDYRDGQMVLQSSAPLSNAITGLVSDSRPRTGFLNHNGISEPALFVTSNLTTGVITDIFAWDGELKNITYNPVTSMSEGTLRLSNNIAIQDINGDGYLEIPKPTALPDPRSTGSADFWSVQWIQYSLDGQSTVVYTTYYNGEDGWYLVLPETWQGRIALSRQDNTGSGERGVLFYPYTAGETERNARSQPFLSIYKLTGPNRVARAHTGVRFILLEEEDTIYAAEFHSNSGWDCGVDQEGLKTLFNLIQSDW